MKHPVKLSKRLEAIAAFIENGASVADIGTDHGFLPAYLAQSGLARRIVASDASAGSLGAARRTAERYGVTDMVEFVTAPGLSGVSENEADTVVIAGMGGETIVSILEEASWKKMGIRFILQPQTKMAVLCDFLQGNGYAISDMKTIVDRGREYTIILCVSVCQTEPSP